MKILLLFIIILLTSCGGESGHAKIYEDSARYYSEKWSQVVDSGFTNNEATNIGRKNRAFIYQTMRQHYIDKAGKLK